MTAGEAARPLTKRMIDGVATLPALCACVSGTAELTGEIVKVSLTACGLEKPKGSLQIALIEDPVTNRGENGLRFHPMLVRNLARGTSPRHTTSRSRTVNPAISRLLST